MNGIMKIVKSLEESVLSIKRISETTQNEVNEQKDRFLSMLLGILGASLLITLSTDKDTSRTDEEAIAASQGNEANISGWSIIRAGEGTIKIGYDFSCLPTL